jgi:4-amino-4-deoxy-L-arabinose transferase-like glycosyltransferase
VTADPGLGDVAVRHRVLLLVLIGLLLYVPFLGLRDLWYPDEPDIGEVCQAMYESGDWVAPRRMGVIWVDYPPMLYWAGAASAHALGGMSEFALRLPNALAAVALVALTCVAVSRWLGARAGLWAGFLLLTFQQYAYQAIGYRPDVLFSLWITAGFFAYAAGAGERPRWWLRVLGFACFGLAMLAKGPLGLLLPGLVLTLWHGSRREWRRLLELAPLAAVALAVYLPWFVACARAMGADSILHELYAQNVARFFAGGRGHAQPVYYYLVNVWVDLAPWSLLLPFGIAWLARTGRLRDRDLQLALWWFGTFLVFLTLAVTKRQLYLLPAYPAAALLLAPWVANVGRGDRSDAPSARVAGLFAVVVAALLAVLGAASVTAVVWFDEVVARAGLDALEISAARDMRWPLAGLGVVLVAAALWIAAARRRPQAALVRTGVAHLVMYLLLSAWVLPPLNPTKSYREQGAWMRQAMGEATHFGLVNPVDGMAFRKMGAFGYYTGRLTELMDSEEQVEDFFRRRPSSIVLVEQRAFESIFTDPAAWRSRVVHQLQAGRFTYLVVAGSSTEESKA